MVSVIIVLDFLSVPCIVFPPQFFFSLLSILLVSGFYLKGIFQISGVVGCLFIPKGDIEVDLRLCMGGTLAGRLYQRLGGWPAQVSVSLGLLLGSSVSPDIKPSGR